MIKSLNTPAGQLASGALLATAVAVAYLVGDQGTGEAVVAGAIVLGFVLLVFVARRRSDTFEAMSGMGDERTRHLYQRSVAFAGTVMSLVLPGWWLVTVARASPTSPSVCRARSSPWPGSARWSCSRGATERPRAQAP
jgi:hypothetical protein